MKDCIKFETKATKSKKRNTEAKTDLRKCKFYIQKKKKMSQKL